GGLGLSVVALITIWNCSAFVTIIANGLARIHLVEAGLPKAELPSVIRAFEVTTVTCFNGGGLLGTLLTVPIASAFGRRAMFRIYFVGSALSLFVTFGLDLPAEIRAMMYFFVGLTVMGIFGSFAYYLPELYPTRLRGTGSGFCYNAGRIVAALGPFV